MPTIVRREPIACPICGLTLAVLRTKDGATVEYNVADWTRLCHHGDKGSPLLCPSLEALRERWLRGAESS